MTVQAYTIGFTRRLPDSARRVSMHQERAGRLCRGLAQGTDGGHLHAALEHVGSRLGGSQTTDGSAALGSNEMTSRICGGAAGADYRLSPSTVAGFA